MAGLDDFISGNSFLRSLANYVGMQREVEVPPEIEGSPYTEYGDNLSISDELEKSPLKYLPRSTIPTDLPTALPMYRADPTGKFGGKDGLETLPLSRFTKGGDWFYKPEPDEEKSTIFTSPIKAVQELYRMARINGAAEKHGLPYMTPDEIGAFALKEGRSDLGHGAVGGSNRTFKFQKDLLNKYNITDQDANFITAIGEKRRVADKLKIPFSHAWNGVGVNAVGVSGADYAKDWENHRNALANEKNKPLMDFINRAIDDGRKYGFPLKENKYADSRPQIKKVPYKTGGSIDKPITGGKKDIF
jgi:hypothetical protein